MTYLEYSCLITIFFLLTKGKSTKRKRPSFRNWVRRAVSTNWLLHSLLEFSVCIMYNVFCLFIFQWNSWEEKSRSPKDQNVYKFSAEDKNHNLFTRTISLKEEIVNRAEFKIKWLFPKRDCVFRPKLMTACSEYFVKFNTPLSRNKKSYRFVAFMSSLTEKACDIDFIFVRISFILMSYDDTSCKFLLEKNFCFFKKNEK